MMTGLIAVVIVMAYFLLEALKGRIELESKISRLYDIADKNREDIKQLNLMENINKEKIMGVDYSPVGGVGILLDKEMLAKAANVIAIKLDFDHDEDEDDTYCVREQIEDILSEIGIPYSEAGCSYSSDDLDIYLQVQGKTLMEVNKNVPKFISKLKEFDIIIEEKDIIVIEELHVW